MKRPVAVNIRGTHGSGKSTIVKTILERYGAEPTGAGARPEGYITRLPGRGAGTLYTVGPYATACGGCDAVQPYALIWPRVTAALAAGHNVLFEGALVSSSYGNIGRASEALGDRMIFAFLDTPLDVCLARIAARRAARGNLEPVNPGNTAFKHAAVERSIPKFRDEFKRRVVVLQHNADPVREVLTLLGAKP